MRFFRIMLHSLVEEVWKRKQVPSSWQLAMIILLPKTDDTSAPGMMRPIALTNCDGKLFFTIVQRRLTKFMVDNGYINPSIQKAFMPGVAGCIEHNQLLWDALKNAKMRQVAICVSWLDLRNAYGSVRHNLIQFALKYYHFPPMIIDLIFDYYDRLMATVKVDDWSTPLFQYGIGVFQGCTMSTILFNITFNLLYEWLKNCPVEPFLLEGVPIRETLFADDIAFITRLPAESQKLLVGTDDFLAWTACMAAKPSKCKSLAFAQFKPGCVHTFEPYQNLVYSAFDPRLLIAGQTLEFIKDQAFKFLGRKIFLFLDKQSQRCETRQRLLELLEIVDKCPLMNTHKLWLFNYGVVPRLSWYFLVYNFPLSFVEELDDIANRYIKSWAGILLHGSNPVLLYLPKTEKGLGIVKLSHYWANLGLVREHLLKYSGDPYIRKLAGIRLHKAQLNTQLKWTAPTALVQAERGCQLDSMMRGQTSRHGLGYGPSYNHSPDIGSKEHRAAVIQWQKDRNVESLLLSLSHLTVQQDWTHWEGVMWQDMSWKRMLYRMSNSELKFYLQGTLQIAPTPSYLKVIGVLEDAKCPLCHIRGGKLYHILSVCNIALEQGRFKWRHDEVLRVLRWHIDKARRAITPEKVRRVPKVAKKVFVLAGVKPTTKTRSPPSILEQASDWCITTDLPEMSYHFPAHVAVTGKKPDIVLWSNSRKRIIMIELTVPAERGVQQAHKKTDMAYGKPGGLADACRLNNWTVDRMPVEVGALGFVADSMRVSLKALGAWSKELHTSLSEMALRCSYLIFLQHKTQVWTSWRMFKVPK